MTELRIGAAVAARIEESYAPNFNARKFFPDWDPAVEQEHGAWLAPGHYDPASGFLKLSVHSWLLTLGGKRILIDTCVGNHKARAARPQWNSFACADAANARLSRRRALEHCAGGGALLLPAHFGAPFACRIDSRGDRFEPRFVG